MAAIKFVYIGGGSTRAPGTLAAFIEHARYFDGSEIVLVDVDAPHLALVRELGQRMIEYEGLDLRLTTSLDRRAALADADAVLTAFRPGGFAARVLDERLPLKHNVIGHETEGPGGFFLALRTLAVLRDIVADMEAVCPDAWLFNCANPVGLLGEALAQHSPVRTISLSSAPLHDPRDLIAACGLDPAQLDTASAGLSYASWSVKHSYAGQDVIPLIAARLDALLADPAVPPARRWQAALADHYHALPAAGLVNYYYTAEVLAEQQAASRTRAETVMAALPDMWTYYAEQAEADRPVLEADRARGGLRQLELAVEVLAAVAEDLDHTLPCSVPNNAGCLPGLPPERVVEIPCRINEEGATPLAQPALPAGTSDLIERLAAYQALAAEAAWGGTRAEAIAALAANPLVPDADTAAAVYADLADAHRAHLPPRLLE
jgi:6-phospho-beta-glucosidase